MTLLAAAATFVLSATMPTLDAPGTDSAHVCLDLASCIVYRAVQSQTWRDSSAVMLRDPASWARNWPKVRAEAEPRQVASVGLIPQDRGLRKSFTLPDSLKGNFTMTTRDASLNESAASNWVGR